jgi:hypothetical protein
VTGAPAQNSGVLLDETERRLLRLGFEGRVELCRSVTEAREAHTVRKAYAARDYVRLRLDSWLAKGWVELWVDGTAVPPGERTAVHDRETNWDPPRDGNPPVWFTTLSEGTD